MSVKDVESIRNRKEFISTSDLGIWDAFLYLTMTRFLYIVVTVQQHCLGFMSLSFYTNWLKQNNYMILMFKNMKNFNLLVRYCEKLVFVVIFNEKRLVLFSRP